MNKVNWIVENFVKEESFLKLEEALIRAEYPLQLIKGDFAKNDISQYKDQCVVFNGSIEMCKMINQQLISQGCSPNIYCSWDKYLCSAYYPQFAEFIFNDDYVLVPLLELQRRLYKFYGWFGKDAMLFVRPDSGDKTFKAELLDLQDFPNFYDEVGQYKNELILISTPKNIIGEWRFVCTKYKEILAMSSYRYHGKITRVPSAPVGATNKVKEILEVGYYPDSVFCIDIVEDSDGNYWMMELTSFSSAGLYACKMDSIIHRVSEIALEDHKNEQSN